MTPVEAVVYASERSLMLRGLVVLTIMGVAGGLLFAMLYGTVNPRLRRMIRRSKRQSEAIAGLKREILGLTQQNQAMSRTALANEQTIFDAQQANAALELEVRRNRRIRQKTEDRLREQNTELETLRQEKVR